MHSVIIDNVRGDRLVDIHSRHKQLVSAAHAHLYDFDEVALRRSFAALFLDRAHIRMCSPFGDLDGSESFIDTCYMPLGKAMPDLERRTWILVAGLTEHGGYWVGSAGHYFGTFVSSWLDIPPTGHLAHLRFHEFFRFEDEKVIEFQAIWDIPEIMMQARAWPLAPSLGREFCIPSPASMDGLVSEPWNEAESRATRDLIIEMLTYMKRHPSHGGADVMEMERFWHPKMNWYGPAGIGTGRGIAGFRNWHQIPFLRAMPDRGQYLDEIIYHFFGDANYAAVTGWPNMIQTVTQDGWLGIAPSGRRVTMRSLDFWRVENGLIRENWVMVDLLDVYRQLNVDVFGRMREFNKARVFGDIPFPIQEV